MNPEMLLALSPATCRGDQCFEPSIAFALSATCSVGMVNVSLSATAMVVFLVTLFFYFLFWLCLLLEF